MVQMRLRLGGMKGSRGKGLDKKNASLVSSLGEMKKIQLFLNGDLTVIL